MENECQHKFSRYYSRIMKCLLCDKTVPVILMKRMSKEEFAKLFPFFNDEAEIPEK